MAPDPGHRASDADREAVSGVIRDAAADGRLGMDELDERLSAVWSARTYGELALTTTDLPVDLNAVLSGRSDTAPPPVVFAGRTQLDLTREATAEVAVAVFGSTERRGSWTVPATLNAVAAFGGVELDLREATLTARETVIHAFAIFGGITITVGEDVELVVNGAGILGGFEGTSSGIRRPGAPVVRVVGLALFGGVEVRQRPRRKAVGAGRDASRGPVGHSGVGHSGVGHSGVGHSGVGHSPVGDSGVGDSGVGDDEVGRGPEEQRGGDADPGPGRVNLGKQRQPQQPRPGSDRPWSDRPGSDGH